MKIAGLAPRRAAPQLAVPAAAAHWAQEFLRARGYRNGMKLVGFHAGASTREKQWPVEYFIELGEKIRAAGQSMIILYGSDPEDDISGHLGRSCINALGATTIPQLAALLQVTDILITNDTGPMHIAAACGTRVISIHMGKEMCRTTGPCGSGSIAVQPRLDCHPCEHPEQCRQHACRYAVTPGLVFSLVRLCSDPAAAPPGELLRDDLAGAAVFTAGYDHSDLRDYYPIIKSDIMIEDLCYRLLRIMWCTALDAQHDRLPDPEGLAANVQGLCSVLLNHYTHASLKSHAAQWTTMLAGLQTIEDCGREGLRACDAMLVHAAAPHKQVRSLRELSGRLEALDYKIMAQGATMPLLETLSHMLCVEKENLAGSGLTAQVLHTRRIYQNLRQRSRIMQDIIKVFNDRMAGDAVSMMEDYACPAAACRLLQTDAA
jgi:hypothetical protein